MSRLYIFRFFIISSNQYNFWKFRELKMVDQFKRVIRAVDLAKHILPSDCINVHTL